MITLNLLPDIKSELLEAKRARDRFIMWSIVAAGSVVALVVIAGLIVGVQWFIVDRTKDNIESAYDELQSQEEITTVLTVQNQLSELPGLHEDKPRVTRLFTYLSTLTPESASLSNMEIDFEDNIVEIRGNANTVRDFNALVDTYKAAQYQTGPLVDPESDTFESLATQLEEDFSGIELDDPQRAFQNVVSSLSIQRRSDEGVSFTIELEFNPDLFDSQYSAVRFSVPDHVDWDDSTPDAIFDDTEEEEEG